MTLLVNPNNNPHTSVHCSLCTCPPSWRECMLRRFSHVQLFATLWTVACQSPLSMEFSRQEYWSGLPFPSPGDLLDPRIELRSPALQADSLLSEPLSLKILESGWSFSFLTFLLLILINYFFLHICINWS